MDKIKIQEIQGQEDEAIELAFYAFYPTPGDVEKIKKMAPYFKKDTSFVLYENEKPVSALICKPIPQNVRGVIKTMCGIQNVATHPEARRKGYSKKLMIKAFAHLKENDYAFSTLYPFKESYYEKFGYISFPQIKTAIFSPKQLVPLLKKELTGKVERYSFKEGYELYEKFLKEIQNITHGMGIKDSTEQIRLKDNSPEWVAIAQNNGEIHGMMTYKITGFWKEIKVRDFFYKDSLGKYLLLQFIAIHADQVKEAHLTIKANEYPETWINDTLWGEHGKIVSRDWVPSCMGRVVQVEKLSGLQVGDGKFTVKITDDYCEWNNKVYSFEGKEGILEISETEDFECELTIQGLSSIIYGCYNLDDFKIKNWGKIPDKIKSEIRSLFPKMDPFLYADF